MSNTEKLKLLGQPVRMQLEGHLTTVFLTDYDESSDSYYGESHRNFSMNMGEKLPVVNPVRGLRPYPYTFRPNYAFQFVLPGEDEQVLIDIAQGNVNRVDIPTTSEDSQVPIQSIPPADVPGSHLDSTDPKDLNKDGIVTPEEKRQYKKDHKGEN
jgi:hypothetical protein